MDWSALSGAAIGAGAAIVAVVLTQRASRQVAHDDRVWSDRMQAYEAAWVWAEQKVRLIHAYRYGDPIESIDKVLALEHQVKVRLYGSRDVKNFLTSCQREDMLGIALSDESSLEERKVSAVQSHIRLREQIEKEAGGR